MQSIRGFTLVEIIMVMVILSILAIVAAPRFINLQSSAYKVQQKNIIAAVNSTISLGQVKAAVDGVTNGKIEIDDKFICFVGSYPAVRWDHILDSEWDSTEKQCGSSSNNILGLMELDKKLTEREVNIKDGTVTNSGCNNPCATSSDSDGATDPIFIAIAEDCIVRIAQSGASKPEVKGFGACDP